MSSSGNSRAARRERAAQARREQERAAAKRRNLISVAVVAVIVVVIALAGIAIKNQVDKNDTSSAGPAGLTADNGILYDREAATGEPATGDPVPVVVFSDFQCPVCQIFESQTGEFLNQQVESGAIEIEYRVISFLDKASTTGYSSRALNAAMCVYEDAGVSTWKTFHDALFAQQPAEGTAGLTDDQLVDIASDAGADVGDCITDHTYRDWALDLAEVAFTTQDSAGEQVSGTPTIWVDGTAVHGPESNGQATLATATEIQQAITAAQAS